MAAAAAASTGHCCMPCISHLHSFDPPRSLTRSLPWLCTTLSSWKHQTVICSSLRAAAPAPDTQHARRAATALEAAASTSAAAETEASSTCSRSKGSKQASQDSSNWQQQLLQSLQEPQQLQKLTLKAKITTRPEQQVANVSDKAAAATTSTSSSSRSNDVAGSDNGSSAAAAAAAAVVAGVMPFKQLTVRPVMLKGKLLVQMSLLDARQDITKNYTPQQATEQLQQLLRLPWHSGSLQTLAATTNIQISRKGKVLLHTQPNAAAAAAGTFGLSSSSSRGLAPAAAAAAAEGAAGGPISLQHDRSKALPINGSIPDPFLQRIGLQTADGRIKASMQAKFTQINEFLKLLIHTGQLEHMGQQQQQQDSSSSSSSSGIVGTSSSSTVHVLDCGCGSSHLTFGTLHYLHHVRGLPLHLTGIDTNAALMQRSNRYCADLGISDMAQFHTAAIRHYKPDSAPDIVLALHACDTATDEALALGVRQQTAVIMSVPCCQKDLHRQQAAAQQQQQRQARRRPGSSSSSSEGEASSSSSSSSVGGGLFDPLLSHGILRQRMLDLLTDGFRAQLLQLAGYRTDVVEFVSTEHTPRNLVIRAVRQQRPSPEAEQARLAGQYTALKQYWGVTPHLETLMREDGTLPAALQ